jgi:hypothetical protein
MQYFAIPAVSGEATPAHDGTTTLPTTPVETFVFGRQLSRPGGPGRGHRHGERAKPIAVEAAPA